MIDIFFCGVFSRCQKKFVVDKLSKFFLINYWDGNLFQSSGNGNKINIYFTDELKRVLNPDNESILVIYDKFLLPDNFISKGYLIAISDSGNAELMQNICKYHFPVITCGTSFKDTVSFSSLSDENLVISLNREIIALSGETISPFEFPFKFNKNNDIYSHLSLFALMVLLDCYNSLS